MKRRHLLAAVGAAATSVGLSGCASHSIEQYAQGKPVRGVAVFEIGVIRAPNRFR